MINLLLAAFEADFYLLFSAQIPTLIYYVALMDGFAAVGFVIAVVMIGVYLLCYLLSKKRRAFILAALIFFIVDAIIFLFLFAGAMMDFGFEIFDLIEVAFYVWIMYYLVTGTKAWAYLRNVSAADLEAARQDIAKDEEKAAKEEEKAAVEEIASSEQRDKQDGDEQ